MYCFRLVKLQPDLDELIRSIGGNPDEIGPGGPGGPPGGGPGGPGGGPGGPGGPPPGPPPQLPVYKHPSLESFFS